MSCDGATLFRNCLRNAALGNPGVGWRKPGLGRAARREPHPGLLLRAEALSPSPGLGPTSPRRGEVLKANRFLGTGFKSRRRRPFTLAPTAQREGFHQNWLPHPRERAGARAARGQPAARSGPPHHEMPSPARSTWRRSIPTGSEKAHGGADPHPGPFPREREPV
jgi:hypothetical protein